MAIRVSGLVSGLDTDSIVQELVAAYSTKKDKHVKAQTKLEWKMDIWKDLNKKVNKLYKKLGNMKLSSYYNKKTTTVSDPTKATVVAGNNALNGSQTLKIEHVATTGYLTGGELGKGTTGATTLKELGLTDGAGTIAVTANGETKNIDINEKTTISEFVTKLQDAGVAASFDDTNHRLHIASKKSGVENDFALTATDAKGLEALKELGIYVDSKANQEAVKAWEAYTKDPSGNPLSDADIRTQFTNILNTIADYQDTDVTNPNSIAYYEDKNSKLRTDITNLQTDRTYAVAYMSVKDSMKDAVNDGKLTQAEANELEGYLYQTDEQIEDAGKKEAFDGLKAKLGYSDEDFAKLRSNARNVAEFGDNIKNPDNTATVTAVENAYNSGDMDTWFDQNADDITAASDQMQANSEEIAEKQAYIKEHALLTGAAPANDTTTINDRVNALMDKLNFVRNSKTDTAYSSGAGRVDGTDAVIYLNNVRYQSASNDITVNGITITALQKTTDDITITTQVNTEGIYNSIKDFLKEYNELIKEMDELYNADSARGYDPLTDDEKDAMSDKEIEKWEEKIKKSLLRRDDSLSSVMNLMTSTMAQGFTLSDGKKYSLSSFGIKTQGYLNAAENEGYCFHIDGDSEDEISAGNNGGTNSLLKAIQEDPDMVQEFFQTLTNDLYTKLDKKMQSTTLNSKFSIYNDKKMQNDYNEYSKTIKKWEEKVSQMEEYYYNKFAAMEKALSSLQNSTSALGGLLGS